MMVKTVALVVVALLVVLVAAVLVVAATKPDTFRVQRSISIDAPPEKVFPLINDFHQWTEWSPYEKLDPAMKRSYSGSEEGKGAVYEWDGNGNVGKGRTEITAASPSSEVNLSLDMVKPFRCHNDVRFTLQPQGESTKVTWAMEGPASFYSKVMQVFIDMDRMVGGQFDEGLAGLKTLAEK